MSKGFGAPAGQLYVPSKAFGTRGRARSTSSHVSLLEDFLDFSAGSEDTLRRERRDATTEGDAGEREAHAAETAFGELPEQPRPEKGEQEPGDRLRKDDEEATEEDTEEREEDASLERGEKEEERRAEEELEEAEKEGQEEECRLFEKWRAQTESGEAWR
ncbi:UNVERIFIED_CONTAM: hypothetical protein HHA_461650 [Hammondia hammondi]|eukprot:XP_008881819.1 hypothetical protein HHA_461650 [Hammondia hammondi]